MEYWNADAPACNPREDRDLLDRALATIAAVAANPPAAASPASTVAEPAANSPATTAAVDEELLAILPLLGAGSEDAFADADPLEMSPIVVNAPTEGTAFVPMPVMSVAAFNEFQGLRENLDWTFGNRKHALFHASLYENKKASSNCQYRFVFRFGNDRVERLTSVEPRHVWELANALNAAAHEGIVNDKCSFKSALERLTRDGVWQEERETRVAAFSRRMSLVLPTSTTHGKHAAAVRATVMRNGFYFKFSEQTQRSLTPDFHIQAMLKEAKKAFHSQGTSNLVRHVVTNVHGDPNFREVAVYFQDDPLGKGYHIVLTPGADSTIAFRLAATIATNALGLHKPPTEMILMCKCPGMNAQSWHMDWMGSSYAALVWLTPSYGTHFGDYQGSSFQLLPTEPRFKLVKETFDKTVAQGEDGSFTRTGLQLSGALLAPPQLGALGQLVCG